MRRIERLYAITDMLRRASPRTVASDRLADELGVSRRTIERDLAALRAAGAPVYGQQGRGGGVGSVASQRRSSAVVAFTDAEIVALVIAAHLSSPAPYSTAAAGAVGKLLDTLDEPRRVAVELLRSRLLIASTVEGDVNARVRSVVEDGVRDQTVVRLQFVDRSGERTSREVEPAGFYCADGEWSLVAWCRLRQAGRMFLLRRVVRATPTTQRCAPRHVDEVLGWVPRPGVRP